MFQDTLHKYYTHTVEQGKDYFYDLDHHNFTGPNRGKVKEHDMLSQSYRRAATINLSFKFPFYGHLVPNITIATGGFLYTGDYVHSWLAATQYIAPLMANFDTSSTHNAKIRYLDDGDKLIVEWKDVYLQDMDKMTGGRDGPFTFQVILFQNGNITFAYQTIPVDIKIITVRFKEMNKNNLQSFPFRMMIIRLKSVFQMLTSLIEQFIVSFIWLKLTTDVFT